TNLRLSIVYIGRIVKERGQVRGCRRAIDIIGCAAVFACSTATKTHPNSIALDRLKQSLGLGRPKHDPEASAQDRAVPSKLSLMGGERGPRDGYTRAEVSGVGPVPISWTPWTHA